MKKKKKIQIKKKKMWLEQCPDEFKPVNYRKYVDDIFPLLNSQDHLTKFQDYLNTLHTSMEFSILLLLFIKNLLLVVFKHILTVFYHQI